MKLLLTSCGITNKTIASVVQRIAGNKVRIAFIPTAANVELGDKTWLIQNFIECQKIGTVDIVDVAALERSQWLPRVEAANVIVVGGGNTPYLAQQLHKSGFANVLPRLLQTRLYVGISAGSIVLASTLGASSQYFYGESEETIPLGLGLVSFTVRPHLNSPDFPRVRLEELDRLASTFTETLYALDDDSAVLVEDDAITVVSEGVWKRYDSAR
jgi:dipeptidase E